MQLHAAREETFAVAVLAIPMSPVATPRTAPLPSYSTSAAAKPG
jgi:hypothetical protein